MGQKICGLGSYDEYGSYEIRCSTLFGKARRTYLPNLEPSPSSWSGVLLPEMSYVLI